MKSLLIRLCIVSALLMTLFLRCDLPVTEAAVQPNIIVIMSDDMGYTDIGSYGGEINTPNLDALAANGLRMKQFYNMARCCPTRASLLTGLYPHQAGVGHMMEDRNQPGYRGDLNQECVTLAEALQPAGYSTYAVGKWHVTPGGSAAALAKTHNWPLQRGFERFYGTIHGAGSFYDPSALVRDNKLITVANDPEYQPKEFYYTDALSDQATRFISEHETRSKNKPFFMYLTYTAAHWPMHALARDIAKYKGKYDAGYEPIRRARWEKAKRLGLIDASWQLSPQAEDWSKTDNHAWEARLMEVYAAMIDNMDQGIGRIVAELKRQGKFDNTLIFFLQDNGGCAELTGRQPTQAHPHKTRPESPVFAVMGKDEQQYNSTPRQTRTGFPVIMGPGAMPGGPDTYMAYGRGWANVSNTPFREYKHWMHEGGISTPLIMHWPKGISAAQRNKLVNSPGHLIDIMATCVDVGGAKYPTEYRGQRIQPMEGVSLRPVFTGKALKRPQPIFWEHEGNRAIRAGDWKLVAKENRPWELYNIAADRTEMNDLAAKEPERVKQLAAQWEAWAARARVLPLGTWRANPQRSVN